MLVGDLHVINAMPALQDLLDALASQHVALLGRLEELNAAPSRHRVAVVAVAGEGKGGIGQGENEAAVADTAQDIVTGELCFSAAG